MAGFNAMDALAETLPMPRFASLEKKNAMNAGTAILLCAWTSVLLVIAGCVGVQRHQAVPYELQGQAVVPGMPVYIRSWADHWSKEFAQEIGNCVRREIAHQQAAGNAGNLAPADFLAISGGGSNGAFGAGLLCGWSATGTRPMFKAVSGISTGALSAPYAFLGEAYDEPLKRLYTTVRTSDILKPRGFIGGVLRDALTDNRPLWELLRSEVNDQMLAAIAAEYSKGRMLLIMTTDLDAQRPVVWNMGAIAASGHPRALDLFHSIMIASAAIPAAFPPEMMDVEVNGQRYQEMHVDGGAMAQVFIYPSTYQLKRISERAGAGRKRTLYIIRNARLDPAWGQVERQTLKIAGRAIASLIQSQGIGDLYRLYMIAQRDEVDFNLAYIPASFTSKPREEFDPVYMSELFEVGYASWQQGPPWHKVPPGWAAPEISEKSPSDASFPAGG